MPTASRPQHAPTALLKHFGGFQHPSSWSVEYNEQMARHQLRRPERFFADELPGENVPSFVQLQNLYEIASDLADLQPWNLLDESQLVLLRESVDGELCYCSVMGALGEVFALHAYIGLESFRLFRRISTEEIADPGEFFSSQHSVYVEFVPRRELERQDRNLLAALGHPLGKGMFTPIFRAIRPGFHPWFVSAEEAQILTECIQAVVEVARAALDNGKALFWREADSYPLVSKGEGSVAEYRIDLIKVNPPNEPPPAPAKVDKTALDFVLHQDFAVSGVMELDHILSGAPIGGENERKACACFALALDSKTGIIYAPEVTDCSVAPADALAKVFLKSVQANRTLPKEVRVRTERLRDCLAPLMDSLGVYIYTPSKLSAADEARAHLLGFLANGKL